MGLIICSLSSYSKLKLALKLIRNLLHFTIRNFVNVNGIRRFSFLFMRNPNYSVSITFSMKGFEELFDYIEAPAVSQKLD
jgi:hypothetical protein